MAKKGYYHVGGVSPKHAGTSKHAGHGAHKHNRKIQSVLGNPTHHAKGYYPSPVVVVNPHPTHPKPHRGFSYSELPICVPEAIAASLYLSTGYKATDDEILELFFAANSGEEGMTIADGLEALMKFGLASFKPTSYSIASKIVTGTIIGTHIPEGSHALTRGNRGFYSWGKEVPMIFRPEEIWHISWDDSQ